MSSPTDATPELHIDQMDPDPHREFAAWFAHAVASGVHEPEAVALATAGVDGRPSVRMVLLRGYGPGGYVWFTNARSRKGREVDANPHAALVAHWASIGRQIRVEGVVAPTVPAASDRYFAGRDRGSQIGAWASHQSEPLADRSELIERVARLTERFAGGPVPRPEHWGGYVLHADRIEFWQHGESRLHDRIEYLRGDGGWTRRRLNP